MNKKKEQGREAEQDEKINDLHTTAHAARAAKEKFYFTGNPCINGHTAARYVSNNLCVDCAAEQYAKKKNPCEKSHTKMRKGCIGHKTTKSTKTIRKTKHSTRSPSHNAVQKEVQIAQAAFSDIVVPEYIRFRGEKDFKTFEEIIDKFAKYDWDDADLRLAALLARTIVNYEEDEFMLAEEGSVVEIKEVMKGKGDAPDKLVVTGVKSNPRKQMMAEYAKNIMAFRRTLALHARATDGEARDVAKRRASAKGVENSILDDDDELFAKPTQTIN